MEQDYETICKNQADRISTQITCIAELEAETKWLRAQAADFALSALPLRCAEKDFETCTSDETKAAEFLESIGIVEITKRLTPTRVQGRRLDT